MKKTEYMQCTANLEGAALLIPDAALKVSNLAGQTQLEYRPLDHVIVVLKKQMTAMELVNAIQHLTETAEQLMASLAVACGTCEECADGCRCDVSKDSALGHLPLNQLLTFAKSGTCLGELEKHLRTGDIVYGG
ncbi:hypothetical protein D1646_03870 [Pseudoflavonifractor sp. 60]|uniref:hypothetical protein n=1 Tax=Pseudoflavonifractor sp. 60 TaxID=2304576 RepID=UPI0013712F6B|nr:hypothetical protein [Pseudoflavonifractor sp. 60]NBI65960.1 hypothetical protein [Pseudoflavonifractor sp. 60]